MRPLRANSTRKQLRGKLAFYDFRQEKTTLSYWPTRGPKQIK